MPPPGHRAGRGPSLPEPGQPNPLLGPHAAALRGRAEAQHVRALGPVGPPDLRRSPDRPDPDRRARGSGNRPSTPPRSRVLAREGPGSRPRHREREGALLYPGAPGLLGGASPDEPVGATRRGGGRTRQRLHRPEGSALAGRSCRAPAGGPSRPPESTRNARGAARARRADPRHRRGATASGKTGPGRGRAVPAPRLGVLQRPRGLRR